eukprot:CAMPEP_0117521034 /NCGR_PEP_ID=MMETSP0784-20121206/33475_1 /TAXON_ID=39447 /ORGANISM="" /LENGTH=87 /DNA_ID=CAMNT_0005317045 /DNA_START=528 /DNA_END=788 /DNA_ORIENTATION=-
MPSLRRPSSMRAPALALCSFQAVAFALGTGRFSFVRGWGVSSPLAEPSRASWASWLDASDSSACRRFGAGCPSAAAGRFRSVLESPP